MHPEAKAADICFPWLAVFSASYTDESAQRNSRYAQPFLIPICSLAASSLPWQLSTTSIEVHPGAHKAAPPCTHCQGHSPSWLKGAVPALRADGAADAQPALLCLGGAESRAPEMPSHTSDFHAPSCLQLGRN